MTELPLLCRCRSFRLPHELDAHKKLRAMTDWRTWREREEREIFPEGHKFTYIREERWMPMK